MNIAKTGAHFKLSRILCAGIWSVLFIFAFTAPSLANPAFAQDTNDGTLHVLRPVLHAEQEEAELCLEFDHDLDAYDHAHIASAIKLEAGGKNIFIKPQNINITANLLCLPSLEHHKEYRIAVSGLRGTKGEKLTTSYGLIFTVPDRHASLSFTGNVEDEGMMRWQSNDPALRSINVPRVHLELYHITDPAMMVSAWRDRQQTTLAPSESATFGHDHGQLVWGGDMELNPTPNKSSEQSVELPEAIKNLQSGLYLIVARAPEAKSEEIKSDEAKSGAESTDAKVGTLTTTAAAWLLRSNLRLHAVRDLTGYYGLTEKADASSAVGNVHIFAESADGQALTDNRSDVNGVGYLPLTSDKAGNVRSLFATTDTGDVDFVDLTASGVSRFVPSKNETSLKTDKSFYLPASTAIVRVLARDGQGKAIQQANTVVSIMRTNGNIYMSVPVSPNADGSGEAIFPVPAVSGIWALAWRTADGNTLAQETLRVTENLDAPRIEMTTERTLVPANGNINLTLKSFSADNKPIPYISGRIFVSWLSPDTIAVDGFKEWKDFHFGNDNSASQDVVPLVSFVTDEGGVASFPLALTPPDDHALLHSAVLSVQSDAEAGVAAPPPLTLPTKPRDTIIGIKPLALNARFPENGLARFVVVALDADGHRHEADDLTYQIYEEGRSFDWYQAEGRWNYKPQQQKRRIGGGALTLGTTDEDLIEWPVAAGTYRLKIVDGSGNLRASLDFSAGWGLPDTLAQPSPLQLTASVSAWNPEQDINIRFTLDKASMITAFIGDDHIRKVIHQFKSQGENSITFTPDKNWGDRLNIYVELDDLTAAGQITLAHVQESADVVKTSAPKEISPPEILTSTKELPSVLHINDTAPLSFDLTNSGKVPVTYHYMISTNSGARRADNSGNGAIIVPAGQSRTVALALNALHRGMASIKVDVTGAAHFHASHEWLTEVIADDIRLSSAIRQRIEPQQSTSWPPNEKKNEKALDKASIKTADKEQSVQDNLLFLSSAPLYSAPEMLAHVLQQDPFTTSEIVGMLETLRLWHGPIIDAGLLSDTDIAIREKNLFLRLVARQRPDGGFAPLPGNAPENQTDFSNTAEVLVAFAHANEALSKTVLNPALEQAAAWLQQRLQNTWFDENERSERASGYVALAEAGRMDNASLHYFSDTSAQKNISNFAALQLAYAFAKIGDQPASAFWIDKSGVKNNLASLPARILPILTSNPFFDSQSILPSLESLSGGAAKDKDSVSDIEDITNVLRATWDVQNRKGAWRVTIDTDKHNSKNILVIPVLAKTISPVIHNTGDEPIFLFGAQKNDDSFNANASRHIYSLNGTEMGNHNALNPNETYLVVLEGPWLGNSSDALIIHDDPGPALQVTGCLPPAPIEADDSLAWLKSQTLSPITTCEVWAGGTDIMVHKDSGASWRAAYLAKPIWSGIYNLPSASARTLNADHSERALSSHDHIEIR